MRLIDADALKDSFCNHCNTPFLRDTSVADCRNYRCDTMDAVDDAPTIDAVPVVRCKACKYYIEDGLYPWGVCRKMSHHTKCDNKMNDYVVLTENDFFCVAGERKEDGDETN